MSQNTDISSDITTFDNHSSASQPLNSDAGEATLLAYQPPKLVSRTPSYATLWKVEHTRQCIELVRSQLKVESTAMPCWHGRMRKRAFVLLAKQKPRPRLIGKRLRRRSIPRLAPPMSFVNTASGTEVIQVPAMTSLQALWNDTSINVQLTNALGIEIHSTDSLHQHRSRWTMIDSLKAYCKSLSQAICLSLMQRINHLPDCLSKRFLLVANPIERRVLNGWKWRQIWHGWE